MRFISMPSFFLVFVLMTSCKDDDGPTVLRFIDNEVECQENQGTIKIKVGLSKVMNVNIQVPITWEANDSTTYLGGDFELGPTLFVKAFESYGEITLNIADDKQLDLDDSFVIRMNIPGGKPYKTSDEAAENSYKVTILNNDYQCANCLQADLTWHLIEPLNTDIANMELFLQSNVKYDVEGITDIGQKYYSSENAGGFETIILKNTDADQEYFFAVYYHVGPQDSDIIFSLTLHNFDYTKDTATHRLTRDDIGFAIFYGPFLKTGTSWRFNGRVGNKKPRMFKLNKQQSEKLLN